MKTQKDSTTIPANLKAELHQALEDLVHGSRDREAANKACLRMDRIREENRKLLGEQDIAVALIRESRDRR